MNSFRPLVVLIALFPSLAMANPAGEVVRHGAADFVRNGSQLQINQHTQNAIIEWDSFSIRNGETTRFVQPNSQAAALNRVTGVSRSQIDGLLKANGRVLLINSNGIVIGRGGQIDVGGFIASSLDVSDADFLAGGDMTFSGNAGSGAVVNLGTINARDGDVFLFAPRVENAGSISAPNGTVGLGGGTKVLLKASGDERVFVEGEGTVVNSGTVNANIAELKAHGGNVYAMAIKNSGRVTATGVTKSGGQIFLTGRGGKISNSGTLKARRKDGSGGRVKIDAGGPNEGGEILLEPGSVIDVRGDSGKGGTVELFAQSLVINDGALVDASGATDGGTITIEAGDAFIAGQLLALGGTGIGGAVSIAAEHLVIDDSAFLDVSGSAGGGGIFAGGGFQGGDPNIENATTTEVQEGAVLKANSLLNGNAGKVILWADNRTDFAGRIEANALGASGHGGFAEVSGKIDLGFSGSVELRGAGEGFQGGTLLLDPQNMTIGAVEAASITTTLNSGGSVLVSTSGAGADAGDIFVNSAIITDPGTTASLGLVAHRHIRVNDDIQIDGTGGVELVAGLDFSTALFGAISTSPPSFFLSSFSEYGIDNGSGNGSVFINDGSSMFGGKVSVGSRSGETGIYGFDVTLAGDNPGGGGVLNQGNHAMIGYFASQQGLAFDIPGNIIVQAKNDITLSGGDAIRTPAQIGHIGASNEAGGFPGGVVAGGEATATGSISVEAGNDILLNAGSNNRSYAQIGHGGYDDIGTDRFNASGAINVQAGRDLIFAPSGLGTSEPPYMQIGHGGFDTDGDFASGNISVMVERNVSLTGGNDSFPAFSDQGGHAVIGHGGNDSNQTLRSGTILVTSTGGSGTLTLHGGDASRGSAQIGHSGTGGGQDSIAVSGFSQITLNGGTGSLADAQIGHGGSNSNGAKSGDISISTAANGRLDLRTNVGGTDAAAQIGHGGAHSESAKNGAITIDAFIIEMLSGGGRTQIGHASLNERGDMTGNITVNSGLVLNMLGGTGSESFALIGHASNADSNSDAMGFIDLNVNGGMIMQGGFGGSFNSAVQVGHFAPVSTGDISIDIPGSPSNIQALQILGGAGTFGPARVGHGPLFQGSGSSDQSNGAIAVNTTGIITIQGGSGNQLSSGQIGHVSHDSTSDGNISVTASGLNVVGGTNGSTATSARISNFSKIGHAPLNSFATGNIDLNIAETSTIRSGTSAGASVNFAQIGHGPDTTGTGTGAITFNTDNLILGKPNAGPEFAIVGHGAPGLTANPQTGFIQVIAQGDITSTGGQIGHGTTFQRFGNTFIGVGQGNPTVAGAGTLNANAASVFVSEPKDSNGQLRFYAPNRDDVDIALGSSLNGVALAANDPFPNEQGTFTFGNGPYSGDFSFYFSEDTTVAPTIPVTPTDPVVPPTTDDPPAMILPTVEEEVDPTGVLLVEAANPTVPQNDPFTVENEFYGDNDEGGSFRDGDPRSILSSGETMQQQTTDGDAPGGFSANDALGGFPEGFEVPDGMVEGEFGVVSFGGDDVVVAAAPPEVAAALGEQLSETAHVPGIPGGIVEPEAGVVSFGEGGVTVSGDGVGREVAGTEINVGAELELGSAIFGTAQSMAVPGGETNSELGVVSFGDTGISATMPPPEVAAALAEALGEAAHDGSASGVPVRKMGADDGVAEFTSGGSTIPQSITEEVDATMTQQLGAPATAELEAAFGE